MPREADRPTLDAKQKKKEKPAEKQKSRSSSKPQPQPLPASKSHSELSKICYVCRKPCGQEIVLRNCLHVVCVLDLIQHIHLAITVKKQLLIECPVADCKREIHENDIDMTLNPFQNSFDSLMSCGDRMALLHLHHEQQIIEALGGAELARACPLCLNIYGEREGCHLVECPIKRCRTRFCWDCNEVTDSLQHFTSDASFFFFPCGQCRLGSDDLERWSLIYKWLNGGSRLGTLLFAPLLPLLLVFLMPIAIAFSFPTAIYQRLTRLAQYGTLTKEETQFARFRGIFLCVVGVPLGLLLGFLSLFSIPFLFMAYTLLAMVVLVIGKINRSLSSVGCFLRCFGLGDLHKMIEQTIVGEAELKRRKARLREIERHQEHPDAAPSMISTSKNDPNTPSTPTTNNNIPLNDP